MNKSFAFCAAIAASWLIGVARADEKPVREGPDTSAMFAQLDTNKDGQLTADEIPDDKKRLFERLLRIADKNNDGKLSAEEFAAGLKPRERPESPGPPQGPEGHRPDGRPGLELMFKRLDVNGDGKITLDEVPQERRERFNRLIARGDKDGDKALSLDEFTDALRQHRPGDGRPGEGRPAAEAGRRPPFPGGPGRHFPSLFSALDTDHDGKLSAAEIAAAPEVIRKLDKNSDGFVTPDEIMAPRPDGDRKDN